MNDGVRPLVVVLDSFSAILQNDPGVLDPTSPYYSYCVKYFVWGFR